MTPGREDLSIRGLEIYIALDGDALQAHNSMTEIRGAWYDGNFKIAPGGVSYPSRPRDTSRLSQFQALGGADYSIRVAFPGWYMIVQANMKAQNLSQLFTHYEYDDVHTSCCRPQVRPRRHRHGNEHPVIYIHHPSTRPFAARRQGKLPLPGGGAELS